MADESDLREHLNRLAAAPPSVDAVRVFLNDAAAQFGAVVSVAEDQFLSAIGPSRHFFIQFSDPDAANAARSALSGIDFGAGRVMVLVPKPQQANSA